MVDGLMVFFFDVPPSPNLTWGVPVSEQHPL